MLRILFLLIFICSCTPEPSIEEIRIQEYGELYFTMNCWWSSQENFAPTIFWCNQTVDTELISGYIGLAIEEDLDHEKYFSICGKEVTLNSGNTLHDTLIASLTEYNYNCIDSYERQLGNEFDWIWDEDQSMLQLIWRPRNDLDKVLTLFVDPQVDSPRVNGNVYYKTGYFD